MIENDKSLLLLQRLAKADHLSVFHFHVRFVLKYFCSHNFQLP